MLNPRKAWSCLVVVAATAAVSSHGETVGGAHESVFDRFNGSVVTVEVVPLAGTTKSVVGKGLIALGAMIR